MKLLPRIITVAILLEILIIMFFAPDKFDKMFVVFFLGFWLNDFLWLIVQVIINKRKKREEEMREFGRALFESKMKAYAGGTNVPT